MAFLDKAYILSTIRSLLNEKSSIKWTDERLNNWINEAAIDISAKTLGYEQTDIITTVANTLEYSEPSGCIKVHGCIKGGGSAWTAHFDNEDWEAKSQITWDTDHWVAVADENCRIGVMGSWFTDYRPTKCRITFEGGGMIEPTISDAPGEQIIFYKANQTYESEEELDALQSGYDMATALFDCRNSGPLNITNIEFYEAGAADTDYKGLVKIHPRLIHHVAYNETGEPLYWYHHHNKIGIYPIPDDAYTITVFYSKVTEDITDLPHELRLLAIPYCLAIAWLEEGWEDDFIMFITMYLNSLMAHRQNRGQFKLNIVDAKDAFQIAQGKVVNG